MEWNDTFEASVAMQTARSEQKLYAEQMKELAEEMAALDRRRDALLSLSNASRKREKEAMKFLVARGVKVD